MSAKHTPGLIGIWNEPCSSPVKAKLALSKLVDGTEFNPVLPMLAGSDGLCVALTGCGPHSEANARRIMACWNACNGISTDEIEKINVAEQSEFAFGLAQAVNALRNQKDGLVDAMKRLASAADDSDGHCYGTLSTSFVREVARAAITKAEGDAS